MNTSGRDEASSESRLRKQGLLYLSAFLLLLIIAYGFLARKPKPAASVTTAPLTAPPEQQTTSAPADQTPQRLQQLVAPIALYPDRLVAQILAAATFPEQIVEAERWMQANPDLTGDAFTRAVDGQPWDASVKALTAVPAVLGNMDKNLAWTSSLGEAYSNDPAKVLDAIQTMRQRAREAGILKSTPQETVAMEDSNVAIQPASEDTVYVPQYDPWTAYGSPVDPWPDWYSYPGIWYGGYGCYFGPGYVTAFYAFYPWGWRHWGFDRHHHFVTHDNRRFSPHHGVFHHHEVDQRPSVVAASADFAERGLSARANEQRMLPGNGANERSLVVPRNLAANFQQRTPPTIGFSGARPVENRPVALTNPAMARVQVPRASVAPPRRQFAMRSGPFVNSAHAGQVKASSAHSGSGGGGGTARGNAGLHR